MVEPDLINVEELITISYTTAASSTIDSPTNHATSRAYLFSGTADTVVHQGVMAKLYTYYSHFIPAANIVKYFNYSAEHSFVTNAFGNSCSYLGSPYINNCNHDAAYELLSHIYNGGLVRATGDPSGVAANLIAFSQEEYFDDVPATLGMDSVGYVYIPTGCRNDTKGVCVCVCARCV